MMSALIIHAFNVIRFVLCAVLFCASFVYFIYYKNKNCKTWYDFMLRVNGFQFLMFYKFLEFNCAMLDSHVVRNYSRPLPENSQGDGYVEDITVTFIANSLLRFTFISPFLFYISDYIYPGSMHHVRRFYMFYYMLIPFLSDNHQIFFMFVVLLIPYILLPFVYFLKFSIEVGNYMCKVLTIRKSSKSIRFRIPDLKNIFLVSLLLLPRGVNALSHENDNYDLKFVPFTCFMCWFIIYDAFQFQLHRVFQSYRFPWHWTMTWINTISNFIVCFHYSMLPEYQQHLRDWKDFAGSWFVIIVYLLLRFRILPLTKAGRSFLDMMVPFTLYRFMETGRLGYGLQLQGDHDYSHSKAARRTFNRDKANRKNKKSDRMQRNREKLNRLQEIALGKKSQIESLERDLDSMVSDFPGLLHLSSEQEASYDRIITSKYRKAITRLEKLRTGHSNIIHDIIEVTQEMTASICFEGEKHSEFAMFDSLMESIRNIPFPGNKVQLVGKVIAAVNHFSLVRTSTDYIAFGIGILSNFVPADVLESSYHTLVSVLEKHFSVKKGDAEGFDKQSLGDIIDYAKHPLSGVMRKLVSLIVVACLSSGLVDRSNIPSVVEYALELPKKIDTVGALEFVFKVINQVMKIIPFSHVGVDWTTFLSGKNEQQSYIDELNMMKYQHTLMMHGDPSKFSETSKALPIMVYRARVHALRERIMTKIKTKKGIELRWMQADYSQVHDWCMAVDEKIAKASLIRKPMMFGVMGTPDVGKTTFSRFLTSMACRAVGLPHGASAFATFNPDDKFDQHTEATVMCMDDFGQEHPQKAQRNPPMLAMKMVNDQLVYANSAALNDKGRHYLNPEMFVMTTNDPDYNVAPYVNFPAAFHRRIDLNFEVFLKDQYRIPGTTQMNVEAALPEANIWNFKMGKYKISPMSMNADYYEYDKDFKLVPEGQGHVFDFVTAGKFIIDTTRAHYSKHTRVLEKALNIGQSFCSHEVEGVEYHYHPGMCPICNGAPPVDNYPPVDHPVEPPAIAGLNMQGSLTPIYLIIRSVISIFFTLIIVNLGMTFAPKMSAFLIDMCRLVYRRGFGTCAVIALRYFFLSMNWMQQVGIVYLNAAVAHVYYAPLTEKAKKAVGKHRLGFLYQFIMVSVVAFTVTTVSYCLKEILKWYKDCGYWFGRNLRSAMFFYVKDSLCAYKNKAIAFAKSRCITILVIAAIAGIVLSVRLKKQGNVQFNQEDVWCPPIPTDVLLNPRVNTTFDDVMNKFKNSMVSIEVHHSTGIIRGNALPYRANYYIMNKHFLATTPTMIKITRYDESLPQSRYCQPMNSAFYSCEDDGDIAVVYLPKAMRLSDFSDLYTNEYVKLLKCLHLWKDRKGNVSENTVVCSAQPSIAEGERVEHSYIYHLDSFVGMCGAALVALSKRPVIVGLHWAGGGINNTSAAVFIKKNVVEDCIKDIERKTGIKNIASPVDITAPGVVQVKLQGKRSFSQLPADGNLTYRGLYENPHTFNKSHVCKTDLYDELYAATGVAAQPPLMKPSYEPVYRAQLNIAANHVNNIPFHLLRKAFDDMRCKIRIAFETDEAFRNDVLSIKPLTFKESLDGTGRLGEEGLKLQTSMGMSYLSDGGKKSKFFSRGDDDKIIPPAGLEEHIEELIAQYKRKESTFIPFKQTLKDEVLTSQKYARVFSSIPVEYSILVRKYFLPICGLIRRHAVLFETVIGMNAYGPDWETFVQCLKKYDENRLVFGDYEKFDRSVTPEEVLLAFAFLVFLTTFGVHYSTEDRDVMEAIASDIGYPLYVGNGTASDACGTVPSGVNVTVTIDNTVNQLRHRAVYYDANRHLANPIYPTHYEFTCEEFGIKGSADGVSQTAALNPDLFHINVGLFTLGDDCVASVKPGIDLSMFTMEKFLHNYGISYTDAFEKGPITMAFGNLSNLVFLKRRVRKIDDIEQHVAPLDEKSIFKSMMAQVPSSVLTPDQHLAITVEGAMYEMFFHGRKRYDEVKEMLYDMTRTKSCYRFISGDTWKPYEARVLEWRRTHFKDQFEKLSIGEVDHGIED